jgi:uncharacterized protein (DUF362 family)
MEQNEIYKIYGTNYKEMTKELLEAADLASLIPSREMMIGIKPNLVTCSPASYGATTHPEVVAGIIEYLRERGFTQLMMLEGSWVGDRTGEAYEYCGYRELAETYQVPFVDTQKDGSHPRDCDGMELFICDVADQVDFMINVPVLKGHCQTRVTCALKNMKGLIPNSEKRRFHTMGLHKPIAHLSRGIHQDFIVVDHICGDLDFEEGGHPVVRNCIMAAADPVLVDSYACSLLNYDVADVPYISMAQQLGSGSTDLSKAKIIRLGAEAAEESGLQEHRILKVAYAVDEVDSCSACYASLVPALLRLEEEGLLCDFSEQIAIGQGHQGKKGAIGVGRCTRDFDFCIMGCPPTEEQIYQGLREYLGK